MFTDRKHHTRCRSRGVNADESDMSRRPYNLKDKALPPHLACAPGERVQKRFRISPHIARLLDIVGAAEFGGRPDSASMALELAVARVFGLVEVFTRDADTIRTPVPPTAYHITELPIPHPTSGTPDTHAAGAAHAARMKVARVTPPVAPTPPTDTESVAPSVSAAA